MQAVVITGDLIYDYHLVQHDLDPAINPKQLQNPILSVTEGGAWYLEDMVRLACSDITNQLQIISAPRKRKPGELDRHKVNESYSIWSLYSRSFDSAKDQVWRTERFLGSQSPLAGAQSVAIEGDVRAPRLLVVDDLGGSFRSDASLWPLALSEGGAPQSIILKTQAPLAEGLLWATLLKKFADRLTVVISVSALRARDAQISAGLSWDRTIREIVAEFEGGKSAKDLALCRRVIVHFNGAGVAIFTRCPLKVDRESAKCYEGTRGSGRRLLKSVRLDRFLYHPVELEGVWRARYPGGSFGASTIMAAATVRHELCPENYPMSIALKRGLEATLINHEIGGGKGKFSINAPNEAIGQMFYPPQAEGELSEPRVGRYCAAFPHELLSDPLMRSQSASQPNLLQDLTGAGYEYAMAIATDVVLRGWERALELAPKAHYGKFVTVDSEEIESINKVRKRIEAYRSNEAQRTILSIAVFGPPGSGKSFAVNELAKELFKDKKEIIEHVILKFNLSQIHSVEALQEKFHKVRTAPILGEIPVVFWDEFDAENLKWLKYFLAPMWDGEFESSSGRYPLGKAIFIFAGGTCDTFEEFDKTNDKTKKGSDFKNSKGPDFVSRLQGSINIKGPNPVGKSAHERVAHLIRRALLLRSSLERFQPRAIDSATKTALISPGVLRAFLRVEKYTHGSRSLELIIRMSSLTDGYLSKGGLSLEAVNIHASQDFLALIEKGDMEWLVIESLAEAAHEAWRSERAGRGWTFAEERDDDAKTSPQMVPYANLSEFDKERNRKTARFTYAKLLDVGFLVVRLDEKRNADRDRYVTKRAFEKKIQKLIEIEHDIWLRNHLLRGFDWAPQTNKQLLKLLLHRDITTFEKLPEEDKANNRAIAYSIYEGLERNGYALVQA